MTKPITRRTLLAQPFQAVIIPKQSEVYRGFQIHYEPMTGLYSVLKPNGHTELDASIEAIRAAIDLIHLTAAMQPACDIDMQAIGRMTQSECDE